MGGLCAYSSDIFPKKLGGVGRERKEAKSEKRLKKDTGSQTKEKRKDEKSGGKRRCTIEPSLSSHHNDSDDK